VEIETENATFWNTMDILLKFKGDNLTGFSNMFRLNVCLLTLHINSDPFFKKRDALISDIKFKKSLDKKKIISQKKKIEINSIADKRFTNLNELVNSIETPKKQNFFLKWGLEELDHPISALPNDFELEFEFEAENNISKIGEIWHMEFQKIEKLRQEVKSLLSKDKKDAYLGKTMLFGDVKLMDIHGFVERELDK
jgi:hypothetical protein